MQNLFNSVRNTGGRKQQYVSSEVMPNFVLRRMQADMEQFSRNVEEAHSMLSFCPRKMTRLALRLVAGVHRFGVLLLWPVLVLTRI